MSLLLTAAIIAFLLYLWIRSIGGGADNPRNFDWWYDHPTERAAQLKWCAEHPQQQDSADCNLAVAAQARVDANGQLPR